MKLGMDAIMLLVGIVLVVIALPLILLLYALTHYFDFLFLAAGMTLAIMWIDKKKPLDRT